MTNEASAYARLLKTVIDFPFESFQIKLSGKVFYFKPSRMDTNQPKTTKNPERTMKVHL